MNKNHWKILLIGLLLGNDPGCNCKKTSPVQNNHGHLENQEEKIHPIDQEQINRIHQFWFFFVQQDFIGSHFLGEFVGDGLKVLERIQLDHILEEQYFEKQKDEDHSNWLKKTEKEILDQFGAQWKTVKQGILLKEEIYAVRPGSYQRFQINEDLLKKLKAILGNEINEEGEEIERDVCAEKIEGDGILGYFARVIQINSDLEKLITKLSEEISLSESRWMWEGTN